MTSDKQMSSELKLKDDEFELLRQFFNRRAGLNFEAAARAVIEQRLGERVLFHGLASFRDYYRLLTYGSQSEAETDEALTLLTTGETYFFRHAEQLQALADKVLPELSQRYADGRRLRIWSAGCSSGEEVYTVAMLLAESELFSGWDVRVIGSDVCRSRIQSARRGRYALGAFRTTARRYRQRYFNEIGHEWEVLDSLRACCEFATINLCQADEASLVGRVHAVLCRNVLIYLDDRSREKVLTNLYDRLLPGGVLLLGHSESLQNQRTAFEHMSDTHDTAYRKPFLARPREANR